MDGTPVLFQTKNKPTNKYIQIYLGYIKHFMLKLHSFFNIY